MKKITAIFLAALMVVSACAIFASAADPVNYAQGATYTYETAGSAHDATGADDGKKLTDGVIGSDSNADGTYVGTTGSNKLTTVAITLPEKKNDITSVKIFACVAGPSYEMSINPAAYEVKVGDSAETAAAVEFWVKDEALLDGEGAERKVHAVTLNFKAAAAGKVVSVGIKQAKWVMAIGEIQVLNGPIEAEQEIEVQWGPDNGNFAYGKTVSYEKLGADGWVESAPERTSDITGFVLTDGNIDAADSEGKIVAFQGTDSSVAVTVDLGEAKNVNEVKLIGIHNHDSFGAPTVKVLVGTSKSSLKAVQATENKTADETGKIFDYDYTFTATKARYVRVEMTLTQYLASLAEFEVFGTEIEPGASEAPAESESDTPSTPDTSDAGILFYGVFAMIAVMGAVVVAKKRA